MVRDEDIRVRLTASTDEDQPVQTEDIYADGKKRRFLQDLCSTCLFIIIIF